MMKRWKEYYTPWIVAEALLERNNGGARLIAGGADLILDMESGHVETPEVLVESGDRVTAATIVIDPAGSISFRASMVEALLVAAKRFDAVAVEAAVAAAQQQVRLCTSQHRATRACRHEMVAVLLQRVLPEAMKQGQGEAGALRGSDR